MLTAPSSHSYKLWQKLTECFRRGLAPSYCYLLKLRGPSVRTLEKSDMQWPLVESLTTHGTA